MPLLTELEKKFGWGYKYFAPTALPATSSIPQRIGQATEINDRMPRPSRFQRASFHCSCRNG
jgi:hypothetical protein